jgi:hypothetical protein
MYRIRASAKVRRFKTRELLGFSESVSHLFGMLDDHPYGKTPSVADRESGPPPVAA